MADHKPQRKPSFNVSTSMDTLYKGSHFERLFPLRKTLFEKFPSANKGLAISGPGIKLGSEGNFSFVSNEKSEKVEYKGQDLFFVARYKRDAKLFDVTLKQAIETSLKPKFSYLLKYEERKQDAPSYVVGGDVEFCKGLNLNFKLNPVTTKGKISWLCSKGACKGMPEGLSIACDKKFYLNKIAQPEHALWNFGIAYDHALGTTAVSYNSKGHVTITQAKTKDKLSVGVEYTQQVMPALGADKTAPTQPVVLAAMYQVDKSLAVKGKLNKDLQLNLAVKKEFSNNLTVTAGTSLGLQGKNMQTPAFGFKVALKP